MPLSPPRRLCLRLTSTPLTCSNLARRLLRLRLLLTITARSMCRLFDAVIIMVASSGLYLRLYRPSRHDLGQLPLLMMYGKMISQGASGVETLASAVVGYPTPILLSLFLILPSTAEVLTRPRMCEDDSVRNTTVQRSRT